MDFIGKFVPRSISSPFYLFVGFLLLYVTTRSNNLSITHDSVAYLAKIGTGELEFHANHLLYTHIVWLASQPFQMLLSSELSIYLVHACGGAIAMSVFYGIMLYRLQFSVCKAFLLTMLVGLSYGVWYYSVSIEIYIFPLALLLGVFYILLSERYTLLLFFAIASLHSLAALFHQSSILFAPVIILAVFTHSGWGMRARISALALYVGACALIVGGSYLYAAGTLGKLNSFGDFVTWLRGNNAIDSGIQAIGIQSAIQGFVGFARALIALNFLFAHDYFSDLIQSAFSANSLADEIYLVRNLGMALSSLLIAAAVILAFLLMAFAALAIRQAATGGVEKRRTVILLLAWLLPYTLFFLIFNPSNVDFWMTQFAIIVMLLGILGGERLFLKPYVRRMLGVSVLLIFFVNATGVIIPAMDEKNDLYKWMALEYESYLEKDDMLVIPDSWPVGPHLSYHTSINYVSLGGLYQSGLSEVDAAKSLVNESILNNETAARLIFSGEILEPSTATIHTYGSDYADFLTDLVSLFCPVEIIEYQKGRRTLASDC